MVQIVPRPVSEDQVKNCDLHIHRVYVKVRQTKKKKKKKKKNEKRKEKTLPM